MAHADKHQQRIGVAEAAGAQVRGVVALGGGRSVERAIPFVEPARLDYDVEYLFFFAVFHAGSGSEFRVFVVTLNLLHRFHRQLPDESAVHCLVAVHAQSDGFAVPAQAAVVLQPNARQFFD